MLNSIEAGIEFPEETAVPRIHQLRGIIIVAYARRVTGPDHCCCWQGSTNSCNVLFSEIGFNQIGLQTRLRSNPKVPIEYSWKGKGRDVSITLTPFRTLVWHHCRLERMKSPTPLRFIPQCRVRATRECDTLRIRSWKASRHTVEK